jgi:60 kDa SS-A/Ro ribonucleoprotein
MANKTLFASSRGALLPAANALNREGSGAYDYAPKQKLAQYAATGCLSNTFYANGSEQLTTVLELARELQPEFLAKCAIYARERGMMKDMPALLLAILSTKSPAHLKQAFPRVIDNGRMLRNFVQILRSGAAGRKSLGTAPKALVRQWLNSASERKLIEATVGSSPSLKDVVRMVHPKPVDEARDAFYGWLLGKPYALERLPQTLQALALYKFDRTQELPEVPFQMLTALGLQRDEWAQIALRGGWHMVRMNLNTFARHGVFEVPGMAERIAEKLRDRTAIARARVFPYQLLMAYYAVDRAVPEIVRDALQDAMEIALENVPSFGGRVVVCPDVSGSMGSPVTGVRRGATSAVQCIHVAALVAAAVLRTNREALVLPFAESVRDRKVSLNPRDSVMSNAQKLASIGGGGTNCSAPLKWLNTRREAADLVILVSDNQSWVDARAAGPTETMRQWAALRDRNPKAKLVCIDLQAHGTTQAAERADVMNVGGFSDEVFDVVGRFVHDELGADHWIERIDAIEL